MSGNKHHSRQSTKEFHGLVIINYCMLKWRRPSFSHLNWITILTYPSSESMEHDDSHKKSPVWEKFGISLLRSPME